jgi:hypothetical protein
VACGVWDLALLPYLPGRHDGHVHLAVMGAGCVPPPSSHTQRFA